MRINLADLLKRHTRRRDQIVDDTDAGFRCNFEIVAEEQIVVLMNAAVEGIFDRQDRGIHLFPAQCREHLVEALIRDGRGGVSQQLPDRLLAEGAWLALKCDSHLRTPSQRLASGAGMPKRSITRSTL